MKKGASQIIATVLLIGITITLASIILVWGNLFFVALSPPANCEKVNFEAGIHDGDILDIANRGDEYLSGFVVYKILDGETTQLEKIFLNEPLKSGYSKHIPLSQEVSGNFLIIPIIQLEDEERTLASCPDNFGIEI